MAAIVEGSAGAELRAEPERHVTVGERREAARHNGLDAFVPDIGIGKMAGGVGKHEPLDPLRRVGGEPHALHGAKRKPAPVEFAEPQTITGDRQARRGRAAPCRRGLQPARPDLLVTAPVVAYQAKGLREARRLRVPPCGKRTRCRANSTGHSARGCMWRAFDLDPQRAAFGIDHRHDELQGGQNGYGRFLPPVFMFPRPRRCEPVRCGFKGHQEYGVEAWAVPGIDPSPYSNRPKSVHR